MRAGGGRGDDRRAERGPHEVLDLGRPARRWPRPRTAPPRRRPARTGRPGRWSGACRGRPGRRRCRSGPSATAAGRGRAAASAARPPRLGIVRSSRQSPPLGHRRRHLGDRGRRRSGSSRAGSGAPSAVRAVAATVVGRLPAARAASSSARHSANGAGARAGRGRDGRAGLDVGVDGVGQVVEHVVADAGEEQLGVGALRRLGRLRPDLALEGQDEVVLGPGAGDVEQADPLVERHLLVDGLPVLELLGGDGLAEPVADAAARAGTPPAPGAGAACGAVDMPLRMVMGNSRPLAAWMVMIRTASSSDSGSTASATRLPSLLWRATHWRYSRRLPSVASPHSRAWSMTNRSRRHTSRVRPSAKPSSNRRRSRATRSASSAGEVQCRSRCSARR